MIELQIKRAGWKEKIQSLVLRLGYECIADPDERKTIITVSDKTLPGWSVEIAIRDGQNALLICVDAVTFGRTLTSKDLSRLETHLKENRYIYDQLAKSADAQEAKAKQWTERQEQELAGMKDIPWLSLNIITDGPYAGRYHARFEPGHPFEFLTLEQVKALYKLCDRLSWKT